MEHFGEKCAKSKHYEYQMKLRRTQTFIIESLFGLLEKDRFETLSVAQITQQALVARNSFYRNFDSKEDIVRTHVRFLIDEFSREEALVFSRGKDSLYKLALIFFPFFRRNSRIIVLMNRNNLISILQDEFSNHLLSLFERESVGRLPNTKLSASEVHYFLAFHSAGLCQVLVRWIENGFQESEEEMAKLLEWIVGEMLL